MTMKGTKCFFDLLVAILLLSFSGCTFDSDEFTSQTDGDALVTFSIQLPSAKIPATRALGAVDEDEVSTIDVLVFEPSGGKYIYSAQCNGNDISTDAGNNRKKTFTVKLRQGNFDLAIVANARSILTGAPLTGMTKSAALSALTAEMPTSGKWITDKGDTHYTPFPMWGNIGDKTINESTNLTGSNAVSLTRMVAKVDVKVDAAVNNFTLTSVHVFNYNTQGTVVPKAITPTIPSTSTLTEGPLKYDNSSKIEINTTTNSCENEIYLFESENHTGTGHTTEKDLLQRTCIVVGGIYDMDGSPTYYRVDFSNGSGASRTFLDVLRNYQYIFNITRVSGSGYSTPESAFRGGPANIEANVLEWNQADMRYAVWDRQNILSVSQEQYYFPWDEKKTEDDYNVLYVMTDYVTTVSGAKSGWYVDEIVDAADGTTPVTWVTLSSDHGAANSKTKVILTVSENSSTSSRRAIIRIIAGRLHYEVCVTQGGCWARSNIVWDGFKLTFAVTQEDNNLIPVNSQGVFFRWGSLVAISPASLLGTNIDYIAGQYPSGHILYSPTGIYNYVWNNIPYISETTVAPFDDDRPTEDDFATYNSGTGFDATTGKGDICRYISAQGWVSGNWRLPTADEMTKLIAEQTSISNGDFTNTNITPNGAHNSSGKGLNAYGYYQYVSGRWLGAGATSSSGETNPIIGVYFPAGGFRTASGSAGYAGNEGYYWSGTTLYTYIHCLNVLSDVVKRPTVSRINGMAVRCVRE